MAKSITPPPIEVAEYLRQHPRPNGNGTWKVMAAAGWGMVLPLIGMWWTALQGRGITETQMHEYVACCAPWVYDKPLITQELKQNIEKIGENTGTLATVGKHLTDLDAYNLLDLKEKQEMRDKEKSLGDLLENLTRPKR